VRGTRYERMVRWRSDTAASVNRVAEADVADGEVDSSSMDLGRAWDATVTLAPDIKSNIPFLGSSRRGSGVVVSLDGTGSSQSRIILTAAHVACLAGSRNAIRVRRPGATDDGDGAVAKVVGVHPRLDLAILAFAAGGDEAEDGSNSGAIQSDERAWLPMATSPVRDGDVVAALGYPMGWSGAIKNIANIARRGQTRAGTWGEVLATYAPTNDSNDSDAVAVTHVLHTSTVASGESGGPLVNGKMEVCGVHSFGDAFQGGERDVAVAVSNSIVVNGCLGLTGMNGAGSELEACSLKPVGRGAYETSMVNAMIVESSDPALAAMCPELTRTQRMSWIM
jgi:S1-C subfamily serine protease